MRNRGAQTVALGFRGLALFLGAFTIIGLIGELRGRTIDVSLWWIDLRDLPGILRIALLGSLAGLLVTWAIRAGPGVPLRRVTALGCAVFALLALRDTARFMAISGSGLVHSTLPVPFSLFVAALLSALAIATLRAPTFDGDRPIRTGLAILASVVAWGLVFPLAQMFFFGTPTTGARPTPR